jgi:hypothetical protein
MALGLVLALALQGGAQKPASGSPQSVSQYSASARSASQVGGFDHDDPASTEKRLKALNADRHKHLVSDTAKLLKLANELHAEVSSTKPERLTPAQLRKVAEIEKLARGVKDKMSYSVGDLPSVQTGPPPWYR